MGETIKQIGNFKWNIFVLKNWCTVNYVMKDNLINNYLKIKWNNSFLIKVSKNKNENNNMTDSNFIRDIFRYTIAQMLN